MKCPHCFNKDARTAGTMDADILIDYIRKNSQSLRNSDLKMMGGEPTLHPRFSDIVREGCDNMHDVKIFTNGKTIDEICKLPVVFRNHMMGKVTYIVNGYTSNIEKLKIARDYIRNVKLHIVVTPRWDDKMMEKAINLIKLFPYVIPVISPDSQVNIFDEEELNKYRKIWVDTIIELLNTCFRIGVGFPQIDHYFPLCFYTQEMIDKLARNGYEGLSLLKMGCCGERVMGLIDWNFDIYYCNQTRIKIGSLLDSDGNPKYLQDILEMINKHGTGVKTIKIMEFSEKCRNCPSLSACKVGCFYNTLSRESERNMKCQN